MKYFLYQGHAAMRFEKGHKEATRRHIVEVASEKFRQEGIGAVGIAGLMADAGLTHGGFYAHFGSKEDLVREALEAGFAGSRLKTDAGLETLIKSYLRPSHRDAPAKGCVIAPLISEIARHKRETRAAFTARLQSFLGKIEAQLPPSVSSEARAATAIGILGVMLGGLQMSRAVTDKVLSDAILEASAAAALRLAK